MLILKARETVNVPVKLRAPANGAFAEVEFTAEFLLVTSAEFDALAKAGDVPLLEKVLVGWSGVEIEDANGQVPLAPAAKHELLSRPWLRAPLVLAYIAALGGGREGN